MRDPHPESDARAHAGLTFFDHVGDGFSISRPDLVAGNEKVDQLFDGFPARGRLHLGNDLLFGKYFAQQHSFKQSWRPFRNRMAGFSRPNSEASGAIEERARCFEVWGDLQTTPSRALCLFQASHFQQDGSPRIRDLWIKRIG